MSTGPVTVAVVGTSDVSAPGGPIFLDFLGVSNTAGMLKVQLPAKDADGSDLTKLRHWKFAVAAGADPLDGPSWDEVIAAALLIVTISITDADAGAVKEAEAVVLDAGQKQTFYIACDDDE